MSKLEKDHEKDVRKWVEDEGGIWVKLLADSRKGIPDNLLLMPPVDIAGFSFPLHAIVEMKRKKGGELSPHQERWLHNLRTIKQPAHVGFTLGHVQEIVEYERQSLRRRVLGPRADLT